MHVLKRTARHRNQPAAPFMFLILVAIVVAGLAGPTRGQSETDEANALREDLADMRTELAELKLEVDELVAQLKARQQAGAEAEAEAKAQAETEPEAEPRDAKDSEAAEQAPASAEAPVNDATQASRSRIDAQLEQLADTQARLKVQLDRLADQQARIERSQPLHTTNRVSISSPFDYRETDTVRIVGEPAPQPRTRVVNAQYTTYSNGYDSGSYVIQARPAHGPVVYVTPTIRGHRSFHSHLGYGHHIIHRPFVHHFSTFPHHRRLKHHGGLTIKIGGDDGFVRYSTGTRFMTRYKRK